MQIRLLITSISFLGAALLSSCQTTSTTKSSKPETPDEKFAKVLVSKTCHFGYGKLGAVNFREVKNDFLVIRSIKKGEEGWWRIGYRWMNLADYLTVNKGKGEIFCSEKNFREKGFHFKLVKEAIPDNALVLSWDNNQSSQTVTGSRPITVSWEGYNELMEGTVSFSEKNGNGVVRMSLPDDKGTCSGLYRFSNDTPGEAAWSVSCTNNLAASGTLKGLGKDKGSEGEGTDTQGRKVKFTVGAKSSI